MSPDIVFRISEKAIVEPTSPAPITAIRDVSVGFGAIVMLSTRILMSVTHFETSSSESVIVWSEQHLRLTRNYCSRLSENGFWFC